ncbi:hypothetical protein [Tsukamurella tyrosinosolvens]|uniref:hypothetical protein n=1 Tax=Tsukamurella tyrosinosolvens TaxID=57704 RepID=UPI0034635804
MSEEQYEFMGRKYVRTNVTLRGDEMNRILREGDYKAARRQTVEHNGHEWGIDRWVTRKVVEDDSVEYVIDVRLFRAEEEEALREAEVIKSKVDTMAAYLRLERAKTNGWKVSAEWHKRQYNSLLEIVSRIVALVDEAEQAAEQAIERGASFSRTVLVDRILEAIAPYPLEKLENKK